VEAVTSPPESATQAAAPLGTPPRVLAAPAGAGDRPLQTRIGLINMTRVLKGSKKVQALQADVRLKTQEAKQKTDHLQKQAQDYQARCTDPATPAASRDQLAQKVLDLRREIEDVQHQANARVAKASGDGLAAAYREIERVANRIAKAKGLELVLFYTDAITEEDYYEPGALQRKMSQHGALVPMIASPGMDITDALIDGLNRMYVPADGPRP
jgi:Skp family chaperone for outer membrane proteins